ncbi:MAG: Rieske 2Fe-2S domain-containing protein [Bryobacterales bacterium]|jgi:cytochrome b6-f complex iron-sulfur subunit
MAESKSGSAAPNEPAGEPAENKPSLWGRIQSALGEDPEGDAIKPRRRFVGFAIAGFLTTNFLMFLRFFFPRTIFEPKSVFRIGTPSDFGLGVDTRYQATQRIWVVRNPDRIFVISAICTHLGCTPDWKESENKFKCPCHGSGYDPEGRNYEGPAPRPMDRAKVELDPEGQIVVDTSVVFKEVRGVPSQFNEEGAFIPV